MSVNPLRASCSHIPPGTLVIVRNLPPKVTPCRFSAPPLFEAVKAALEAAGLKPDVAEVTMRAENMAELAGEDGQRMQKLLDMMEDLDDVQDLYHNAEISE